MSAGLVLFVRNRFRFKYRVTDLVEELVIYLAWLNQV